MRVLMVSPRYFPHCGGLEQHVERLAACAIEAGIEVAVATQDANGRLRSFEQCDGVDVLRFPWRGPSWPLAVSPELHRWLRVNARFFDVVHAHGYHATPALLAALSRPRRLIVTPHYHGTGHSPARALLHRPYRLLGRRLLAHAERVISVSLAESVLLRRHFPAVEAKLELIPNGVDVEHLRRARPYATSRSTVLTVTRLERYKRVRVLIGAAAHLQADAQIVVIGDGPERPRLERLVERHGLGDRVLLLGRVSAQELRRWYRTSSVFVSLSEREAYGLVCVEAIAAGARVIASDIPAHAEVAHRLVPAGTTLVPTDIAPAALAGVIDASLELGRLGPHNVELPSWDEAGARTLALYRQEELMGQETETTCGMAP
jgi:glycosyltransferase involved in cell wall biosynthesis